MKTKETYIFTDNYRGDREFDPFTIEYSNEDEKFEQLIDYFIGSTNCIEECYGLDEIKDLVDYEHIMELISIEEEGNNFLIEIEDGEYTTEYNGEKETWSIAEDSLYCRRIL
jgi:hydroxylamine reductase (hybrid-cluster protein)